MGERRAVASKAAVPFITWVPSGAFVGKFGHSSSFPAQGQQDFCFAMKGESSISHSVPGVMTGAVQYVAHQSLKPNLSGAVSVWKSAQVSVGLQSIGTKFTSSHTSHLGSCGTPS